MTANERNTMQVRDDLHNLILRREHTLAYLERELRLLQDVAAILNEVQLGRQNTVTVTDTSGYSHAPGYMEIDE